MLEWSGFAPLAFTMFILVTACLGQLLNIDPHQLTSGIQSSLMLGPRASPAQGQLEDESASPLYLALHTVPSPPLAKNIFLTPGFNSHF